MIFALAMFAGMSPQAIETRLRDVAAAYYADVARVARVTSRDSVFDYYYRLRDDADSWGDPNARYHRSQEVRDAFTAMSELDVSLATQLMQRSYQPLGSIRGLGETLLRSSKDGTMQPVAVYVPTDYSPSKPARLVVFLHGRDEPESHLLALKAIPALAEQTNTIVIAPYGRGSDDFKGSESDVYDAFDAARAAFAILPKHQYLAGYSMGGFSLFSIAPIHPTDWTAVLSVAGALVLQKASKATATMRNMRVYLVTGERDSIVPTLWPQLTASYLRDAGLQVSFYSEPDGTHDLRSLSAALAQAWTDMERGAVQIPWNLPTGGGLPLANP
jgi:S-formylglutathione hydrolase FrmB